MTEKASASILENILKQCDFARDNLTADDSPEHALAVIAEIRSLVVASLSPAATPVSEAEPVAWRWRYDGEKAWSFRKSKPDEWPDVEMQPLYLAKPASSPAGGDVAKEAAECLESLAGRVAAAGGELDPTGPAQDLAWARRLLPKLRALSQSTSAGRGE